MKLMAHFSCKDHAPVLPWHLTYLHKFGHVTRTMSWRCAYFEVYRPLHFLNMHKSQTLWTRCYATSITLIFLDMSHGATWVVNTCAMFEVDMTYRSRVRTSTIFHWPPA